MQKKSELLKLFAIFFKIGAFTFGGGFAMIPLIEKEISSKGWIEDQELGDIVAISQSIPGAVAVNMSVFVGFRIAKVLGALVAVVGCVLPSFLIILALVTVFSQVNYQENVIVQNAFLGVRSAIVALIIMSAIKIAKVSILDRLTLIISIGSVLLMLLVDIHPIILIISGAALGILYYVIYPRHALSKFKPKAGR